MSYENKRKQQKQWSASDGRDNPLGTRHGSLHSSSDSSGLLPLSNSLPTYHVQILQWFLRTLCQVPCQSKMRKPLRPVGGDIHLGRHASKTDEGLQDDIDSSSNERSRKHTDEYDSSDPAEGYALRCICRNAVDYVDDVSSDSENRPE